MTASGTPAGWLEERGPRRALREGLDIYLERGFGLRDGGHLSFDEIVPNMSTALASRALAQVTEAATRICGLLSSQQVDWENLAFDHRRAASTQTRAPEGNSPFSESGRS